MDGALPPVDAGSWLDFQRRRAEQVARQRIAAAGATAGDWIGRATSALDGLVPDLPPPPPPPAPPPLPAPSPLEGVGDWAQGALARIGQIGSDVAGAIPSAAGLQDFSDRQAANLNATADRYAAERPDLPMPLGVLAGAGGEAWQGLGRVQNKTGQAVQAMTGFGPQGADLPAQAAGAFQVGTTPFTAPGEVASELAGAAGGLPETQAAAQGVMSTVGPGGTIGSIEGGLAANAPSWLRAAPAALAPAGAALGIGTGIAAGAPPAGVVTRGFEGANMGAGVGELATAAPQVLSGVGDVLGRVPYSFGQAAAAEADEAGGLGIRSGQRFRMPRLTPEQQAQRAVDGEAEQRVFDAIQRLWRRGADGEAAADDLRLLAVGKGAEGERAAREYLAAKGLEDVLPAGVVPEGAAAGDGLLGAATRATDPFLARGAQTTGERAFDLAAGTAGGVAAAATADEDATWQERAGRFALGSAAGALGGANLRQLGRVASGTLADDVLGAAAGAAGRGAPPGRGRITLGDIPELMGAIPLAAPTSQLANFTSGMARTVERVAGVAFEGRPIDALVDLGGMVRSLPGAGRKVREAFGAGPTQFNPGMTGAQTSGDLLSRGGLAPTVLTAGTRANAALDEFWRTVNEAGAGARAARHRLGAADTARMTQSAGDFATWGGPNSAVAKKLTELKGAIRDPNASLLDKGVAAAVTSMAPYVLMPERLLRATIGSLVPAEAGVGLVRALKRGDTAAAREFAGRAAAGMAATTALTIAYFNGGVTGDPPADPNERRRREAQGEQWNTVATPTGQRIPSRYLGSLGMQASAIATTLDAARKAQAEGGDPGAVLENGYNAAWRWGLKASYLSDMVDFVDAVNGPQGAAGATRSLLAGQPSRFTGPLTTIIGAADPYERQAETFPEQVASRTGLRALVPTRIDPVTGEDQRREGTGLSRYWGERGDVQTDEGLELARLGLQPRVLGRTEAYEGAKPTPEQRRAAQRALGSETGKTVREAMAKPGYAKLDDAGKKSALQDALRTAADRADVVLGEGVTRGTKQQAQREWDAVPKYVGVQGTPDEVRTQNAAISRAQSLETEYKKKYGEGGWRAKLREEEPDAFALVNKTRRDADALARQRKAIEKKYGVSLG